jgi:signal transduction histidine kinase
MLTQTILQVALADPAVTLDSLRAACEDVIATGKEQAQLIDALLTLARSQRGLDHRELFDLATVARDALDGTYPAIAIQRLTVEPTLGPAPIAGDPSLARTLITNLVENAIRYNHPDGHLEVVTTTQNGHALLRVTNTGPPVPNDQIDRLLRPFQRLDARRNNRDGIGLGVGLSIVSAIAEAHGASLTVRPQPSGGLAVEVTFPSCPPINPRPATTLSASGPTHNEPGPV